MSNINEEVRRWEVLGVTPPDYYVLHIEGKDSADNETICYSSREDADIHFEAYAEHYREQYPGLYSNIFLFENELLVRHYHFPEVAAK